MRTTLLRDPVTRKWFAVGMLGLVFFACLWYFHKAPQVDKGFLYDRGCVVRGPRHKKTLAVEFTGDRYAEGAETILSELGKRQIRGAFFLTGNFYRESKFAPLIRRIRDAGHYLGPHSDQHLQYATWDEPQRLLVTKPVFTQDLVANLTEIESFAIPRRNVRLFLPPYETFMAENVEWARELGITLINYTPGTQSHTDYMEDSDPDFVTSADILKSIYRKEQTDPDGLNGFLLLMHIGSGPGRTRDHLFDRMGELFDELIRRGYSFQRVDELLAR